ncbi:MAG: hypothetical protein J2P15_16935, partial [Micromonosporaceae bacterium]|nr:hypothetical protein [Micromonosporaceae bacterium]
GVGHVPQLEAPEMTARAILDLLDEVAAAGLATAGPVPAAGTGQPATAQAAVVRGSTSAGSPRATA